MNEVIANEKDINDEMLQNYLKYQSLSFFAKNLIRDTQAKNEQLVNNANETLIDLRNAIIREEVPKN